MSLGRCYFSSQAYGPALSSQIVLERWAAQYEYRVWTYRSYIVRVVIGGLYSEVECLLRPQPINTRSYAFARTGERISIAVPQPCLTEINLDPTDSAKETTT